MGYRVTQLVVLCAFLVITGLAASNGSGVPARMGSRPKLILAPKEAKGVTLQSPMDGVVVKTPEDNAVPALIEIVVGLQANNTSPPGMVTFVVNSSDEDPWGEFLWTGDVFTEALSTPYVTAVDLNPFVSGVPNIVTTLFVYALVNAAQVTKATTLSYESVNNPGNPEEAPLEITLFEIPGAVDADDNGVPDDVFDPVDGIQPGEIWIANTDTSAGLRTVMIANLDNSGLGKQGGPGDIFVSPTGRIRVSSPNLQDFITEGFIGAGESGLLMVEVVDELGALIDSADLTDDATANGSPDDIESWAANVMAQAPGPLTGLGQFVEVSLLYTLNNGAQYGEIEDLSGSGLELSFYMGGLEPSGNAKVQLWSYPTKLGDEEGAIVLTNEPGLQDWSLIGPDGELNGGYMAVSFQTLSVFAPLETSITGEGEGEEPTMTVSGRVTDDRTGQGVAGVEVTIFNELNQELGSAVTGADGAYSFEVADTGEGLRMSFTHPDFDTEWRTVLPGQTVNVVLTVAPPVPPSGVEVLPGADSILVLWQASARYDVVGYNVYRADAEDGLYTLLNGVVPIADTRHVDANVLAGQEYYYGLSALDASGNESDVAGPFAGRAGELRLLLPDVSGEAGEVVRVPVSLANAAALSPSSMILDIAYPVALVDGMVQVERTVLTVDMDFAAAETTPGVLRVTGQALAGADTLLVGEGPIFALVLTLQGTVGDSGPLTFPAGGALTLLDELGATVAVDTGDTGTLEISPECNRGDLDSNLLVEMPDAEICTEITVRLRTPDACQRRAGDMNVDLRIDSADTAQILRLANGLSQNPTSFTALTLADILDGSDITVAVGSAEASGGEVVELPINLSEAAGLAVAELVISFPEELSFVTLELGGLTEEFDVHMNTSEAGVLYAGLGSRSGMALGAAKLSGELAVLRLRVPQNATGGAQFPVTVNAVSLKGEYGDDFTWYAKILKQSGTVTVKAEIPEPPPQDGCACGKSIPRLPRPEEVFVAVLTLMIGLGLSLRYRYFA